ncbi:MAG: serine/threonine-protein kinase [Sandaracinaceae bacterium]|nr:MAG: serine/threonine protein kinase [Sandaracinaceae bacterium]
MATQPSRGLDPHASEESRHLLQQRLALLGLVTLCLSGSFLAVALVAEWALLGVDALAAHVQSPRRLLNLAGAAVSALVWLVARAGHRTPTQLLVIDVAGTVAAVVPYTLMSLLGQEGMAGVLLIALTVMLVLQTRALLVPSDARRTFFISAAAAALSMALALGAYAGGEAELGGLSVADLALNLAMWLAIIVAVSTVASWVLFGLRAQVREARRLGQYTLLDKIGEGGMGVVYRARHALLRRPTAVKLLPPERAAGLALRRFEKEVQLTASLVHPNTVTIFDFGHTPDGVFYYAMEYLDGGDLEDIVEVAGPMCPARAVHVLVQIASGLAEAHEIGLIHRDIKPANVLLASEGAVADLAKLVDFGLVRETYADTAQGLTQTDSVMGTPLYLAPEAITDPKDVDARVDIYALGGVGYYLLTGEHVFEGRTVVEICGHHLHSAPVPPSERLGQALPEMLEEILMRCLAKAPDERPASAEELRDLLLGCEGVGAWRSADARAWWAEHGDAVRSRKASGGVVSSSADTIAVDLQSRDQPRRSG